MAGPTNPTNDPFVPSTPDPSLTALIFLFIRSVLMVFGVFGITWGSSVSQASWQIVAGAVSLSVGGALAWYREYKAVPKLIHEAARESAKRTFDRIAIPSASKSQMIAVRRR